MLVVAGGIGQGGANDRLASAEIYSPSVNDWFFAEDLPRKMYGLRAANVNGKVLLAGGRVDKGVEDNFRDEVRACISQLP